MAGKTIQVARRLASTRNPTAATAKRPAMFDNDSRRRLPLVPGLFCSPAAQRQQLLLLPPPPRNAIRLFPVKSQFVTQRCTSPRLELPYLLLLLFLAGDDPGDNDADDENDSDEHPSPPKLLVGVVVGERRNSNDAGPPPGCSPSSPLLLVR